MVIFLIGMPGSGKSTIANELSNKYSIPIISSNILREYANSNKRHSKKVEKMMLNGQKVPDSIQFPLIESKLKQNEYKNGFIIDRFPNNKTQAKRIEKVLKRNNYKLDKLIFLDISIKEAIKRLNSRLFCKKCLKSYESSINKCPKCGSILEKRIDDNEKSIEKRHTYFLKKILPLVKYYKKNRLLLKIDASNTKEEVKKDVIEGLKK